jgi:phosphoribosylanthranilate isomerase
MSTLKLKVCGMRERSNIQDVASLRPDYIGFIFYEKSKRFVGPDFTLSHIELKEIKKVGVFVNAELSYLQQQVTKHGLNFVQLHGDETPEFCQKANALGISVIKAIGIHSGFDFRTLEEFKPFVEHFLFDTKSEAYGGTGKTFDWGLLNLYDQETSFFLSGGIGIEEIEVLKASNFNNWNIHAIDVNSKFEDAPGIKNIERLRTLRSILS